MKKLLLALVFGLWAQSAWAVDSSVSLPTSSGATTYTASANDIRYTTNQGFTASMTITLPPASATCIGQGGSQPGSVCPPALEFFDSAGLLTTTNTVTIAVATGDSLFVNGVATSNGTLVLNAPGTRLTLFPLTSNIWFADVATSGNTGQFMQSQVLSSTTMPGLTTATSQVITGLQLNAGDWDCNGNAAIAPTATTTVSQFTAWISTNLGNYVIGKDGGAAFTQSWNQTGTTIVGVLGEEWALPTVRLSLASQTSAWLVEYPVFGTSTMSGYGALRCRQVR